MTVCVAFLATTLSVAIDADDPVSSNVRFNREISRILQRRCLSCHAPGGLSMSLASYRDVRDWGRAIREEIVEQRMPPATAAPGYGRFRDALGLTAREMTTFLTWLDGGMPRGDERDLPPPFDATGDEPAHADADMRLELPPQHVPPFEEVIVRSVTIDPQLTTDRLVTHVDVRPGSRAVLRGALVYQDTERRAWVGGWLPWQHRFTAPLAHAFRLQKGTPLTVVLYYRGADQPVIDRSIVQLHFAAHDADPIESLTVEAVAGRGSLRLSRPTSIWALQPTAGASTTSLELRAERPDGSIDVLLWMPASRPEWPSALVLEDVMTVPAGTALTLTARGDGVGADRARVVVSAWPATPHRR